MAPVPSGIGNHRMGDLGVMMDKRYLTDLPVPLTLAASETLLAKSKQGLVGFEEGLEEFVDFTMQLERDAMTFALRLYAEDAYTFSPETLEAMDRWKPRIEALLKGEST